MRAKNFNQPLMEVLSYSLHKKYTKSLHVYCIAHHKKRISTTNEIDLVANISIATVLSRAPHQNPFDLMHFLSIMLLHSLTYLRVVWMNASALCRQFQWAKEHSNFMERAFQVQCERGEKKKYLPYPHFLSSFFSLYQR